MAQQESSTAQVLSAPDVLDILRIYVDLEQDGDLLRGVCPVCSEPGRTFAFDPQSAHWVCKRCKDGGDIYHLVERIRRCSHDFAVRFVSCLHAASQQRRTKTYTLFPAHAPAPKSMPDASLAAPARGGTPPPTVSRQAPPAVAASATEGRQATDPEPPPQVPLVRATLAACHQPPGSTGEADIPQTGAPPLEPDVPATASAPLGESADSRAQATVDAPAVARSCDAAVAARCYELAQVLATRLLEIEGCQGVTFVFDGQGEHWVHGLALSNLDEKAQFALDHWMNLTLFRLADLLGGADARQDALFALTGPTDSERIKLLWFPLDIDGLPCHLIVKTQSNTSETLLMRRLRSRIVRLQGPHAGSAEGAGPRPDASTA